MALAGEAARTEAFEFYANIKPRLDPPIPHDPAKIEAYIQAYDKIYQSAKNKQVATIQEFLSYIFAQEYPEAVRWRNQFQVVANQDLHAMPPSIQEELYAVDEAFMVAIQTYQDVMDEATNKRKTAIELLPVVEASIAKEAERRKLEAEAQARAEYVTTLKAEQLPTTPGIGVAAARPESIRLAEMLTKPICIEQPLRGTYLPKQCQYPKAMAQWTDKEKQGFASIIQFIHANRACFIQEPSAPSSMADYLIWQPQNQVCQAVWQKLHSIMEPKYHYYVMEQYLKAAPHLAPTEVEKPFYKKTWFWVTIAAIGAGGTYYYYSRKKK